LTRAVHGGTRIVMVRALVPLLLLAAACSSSSSATPGATTTSVGAAEGASGSGGGTGAGGASGSGGSSGAGGGAGAGGGGGTSTPICDAPFDLVPRPADAIVVGDGSPASCTEGALAAAVAKGGFVAFACGDAPVTIAVKTTIEVPPDRDTVIDGGGLVTLDGGGGTRILRFYSPDWRKSAHVLTVQRLRFHRGRAMGATKFPDRPAPCSSGYTDGQGGALLVRDGVVHVVECAFEKNRAAETGPDVGGGAIYAEGSLGLTIVRSTFTGNAGSNGGAVGCLNADLAVFDSRFEDNSASGFGANSVDAKQCPFDDHQIGSGGNGGAIAIDGGADGAVTICGSVFRKNHGGSQALGGALFRTPDVAKQTTTIDRCLFDANDADAAGAAYFHNSTLVVRDSTFAGQTANGAGVIQSDGSTFDFVNVTFSGNVSHGSPGATLAAFGVDGTIVASTFADGACEADGMFGAAIFGSPNLTIESSLFVHNTGKNPGAPMQCQVGANTKGSGDLQFPRKNLAGNDDAACAPGITFADPGLGAIGDHGGPVPTRLVAKGSPAIGAGVVCPPKDARGKARPATGCTAGATEGAD
jgi:hypothetical protein